MTARRRQGPAGLRLALGLLLAGGTGCGSNAPTEKIDAGQRKYCDARCFDSGVVELGRVSIRPQDRTRPGKPDARTLRLIYPPRRKRGGRPTYSQWVLDVTVDTVGGAADTSESGPMLQADTLSVGDVASTVGPDATDSILP